jgi:tRNA U34 5-methylaminomethyl-2-thiouridine-forming methyltransferase MnmC
MKREIKLTSDGSRTIYLPELDETYHSNHGAFNEAIHIFIEQGIRTFSPEKTVRIFEMGFGTGLNCYLSAKYAQENNITISYSTIEKYPINSLIIST